jgi:hypothetical protein
MRGRNYKKKNAKNLFKVSKFFILWMKNLWIGFSSYNSGEGEGRCVITWNCHSLRTCAALLAQFLSIRP